MLCISDHMASHNNNTNNNKYAPYGTAMRNTLNFKGHVKSNEQEYQKSVQKY